ncbi:MAG TPA: hypothetical protein VNI01_05265 [Elusimicrobiota bacterium]|nr:hypothetical protein [Elusimicrobiota bacterium]
MARGFLETLKQAYGVYVTRTSVYVAKVYLGAKGYQLDWAHEDRLEGKPLREFLEKRILADAVPAGRKPSALALGGVIVAACVPETESFFASIPTLSRTNQMDLIISENPRAMFLSSSDLVTDIVPTLVAENPVVLAGAAKRSHVQGILGRFYELGLRPLRVEPGPWAGLRAAWRLLSPQSGKNMEIRVLVGKEESLVALCHGEEPIVWHVVETEHDPAQFRQTLYSMVRRLKSYKPSRMALPEIKNVIVQGEAEPPGIVEEIALGIGVSARFVPGLAYDGRLLAFGAAMGALAPERKAVNMARSIQRPVSLLTLLPRAQLAGALAAVLLTLGSMQMRIDNLKKQLQIVKADNFQASWAYGKGAAELARANEKLMEQAGPLDEFFNDRVFWAPVLEQMCALLPRESLLTSLGLEDAIWLRGQGTPKLGDRFITMRMSSPVTATGAVPPDLQDYLLAAEAAPALKTDFSKGTILTVNTRIEGTRRVGNATMVLSGQTPKLVKPFPKKKRGSDDAKEGGKEGGKE